MKFNENLSRIKPAHTIRLGAITKYDYRLKLNTNEIGNLIGTGVISKSGLGHGSFTDDALELLVDDTNDEIISSKVYIDNKKYQATYDIELEDVKNLLNSYYKYTKPKKSIIIKLSNSLFRLLSFIIIAILLYIYWS